MCDVCSDFLKLLSSYESQISRESNELPLLTRQDVGTLFHYIQTWPARQCMCCFRDPKNIERFSIVTQGVIQYAVCQLKELSLSESLHKASDNSSEDIAKTVEFEEIAAINVHENDKLLILVSKIFVLNFPLYSAYKQYTIHRKIDDLTQQEMQNLNVFCDLQDTDIPINLIKNVGLFCKFGGLLAMTRCFTGLSPKFLPVSTAHAMISIVCNLKIWMNYKSVMTMLVPLRSCVLRYMCKLSDQDLRTTTIKGMADFMWNAIKDPLEHPAVFDLDGLDLAFKYFTSSTLTMRLAGITQINSQIGMLAEMCNVNNAGVQHAVLVGGHGICGTGGEDGGEEMLVPRLMCDWLLDNCMVTHLFGPNLHAEVIKQSHIILNFLAMENRLSSDHIDTIWAAAQLKHCAKPVHDLLPGLVKHLSVTPALHLYSLLVKLPPKDHTEQTLYLASALIKFIWTRAGGAVINVTQIDASLIGLAASATGLPLRKCAPSSSENSVSLDASNSEEEHGESSAPSDSQLDEAKSDDSDDDNSDNSSDSGHHHLSHHHHHHHHHIIGPPNQTLPIVTSPRSTPPPLVGAGNNNQVLVVETTAGELVEQGDKGGSDGGTGSGPTPCKIPRLGHGGKERSEHLERVRERLVEKGRMEKRLEKERLVGVVDAVVRSAKGKMASSTRKKQINTDLPGGIEATGTSSSQDEADAEAATTNFRKRRKILRRTRSKHKFREKQPIAVLAPQPQPLTLQQPPEDTKPPTSPTQPPHQPTHPSESDSDHHNNATQQTNQPCSPPSTPAAQPGTTTQLLLQETLRAKSLMSNSEADIKIPGASVELKTSESIASAYRHNLGGTKVKLSDVDLEEHVLADIHDGVPLDGDVIAELNLSALAANSRFVPPNKTIGVSHSHSGGPHILELSSGAEEDDEDGVDGSYSSRMSNKSEKNMADFDGEESVCEEELAQLAENATINLRNLANQSSPEKSPVRVDPRLCATFKVENVCEAGNTLLWDLLQDDKIGLLGEGLALEAEKTLCNLLCYNTDRTIRMKFIEGCLRNLANNTSVLVSLRLLPKLLTSFQQFRGLDIHHVTQWADRQHHMMKHFFANLRTYVQQYNNSQQGQQLLQQQQTATAPTGIPSSCSSSSVTSVSSLASSVASGMVLGIVEMGVIGSAGVGGGGGDVGVTSSSVVSLGGCGGMYSHQMQVQVRLHFLTAVYSPLISPSHFKLSVQQLDTLWLCLAEDPLCSDELFSWLLTQAKSSELHALGIEALKRLYNDHLPRLSPATFSATGLSLFQQLCNLTRIAASAMLVEGRGDGGVVGMEHMWRIALRAYNTEVSMSAIQYLNSYYMSHNLQHEDQFVAQCMSHLAAATDDLVSSGSAEDAALLCIQRALLLLKTHIETFKRRYAYHLRRWALEGKAITCHAATSTDRACTPIRLIVQPGGMSERCMLDLLTSDYVADLRAEISKWWEDVCMIKSADVENATIFADSPIRIITQGQELTTDCDEKTLGEMGFKDNQMIYISMSVPRNLKKRECLDSPSLQPPPSRQSIPTLLLLRPLYFEQLFSLMHTLSAMSSPIKGGQLIPHTKAQVLSRRVWDILLLLPTNPELLGGFERLEDSEMLGRLLDPSSAQKLMYSLYIIEGLSLQSSLPTSPSTIKQTTPNDPKEPTTITTTCSWNQKFVQSGGLRHLFDIFMSGVLQQSSCMSGAGGKSDSSEWQQDCLATLLKLLCQLGVEPNGGMQQASNRSPPLIAAVQLNAGGTVLPDGYKPSGRDRIVIARLNEAMLSMLDVNTVMPQLTNILNEASLPRDPNHFKTGFWGRAQVVHYAMSLLVSWLHCNESARRALFQSPDFSSWLQRLVLDDPEPAVRREMCSAIYRLCLGILCGSNRDRNSDSENSLVAPMLCQLVQYMDKAESMRPHKEVRVIQEEEGKEPYGPACRDYFWLISRLVDSLPEEVVKESLNDPLNAPLDLDSLTSRISDSLLRRECLETRHRTVDDDGLIGLLNLLTNLLKHRPRFQTNKHGKILLTEVFDFLFALPHSKLRHVPKCKSGRARTAAFDLLVELVKAAPENYDLLFEKLLRQHQPGPNSPYPWDYWPHEDGRSECGYVGLTNLGATCYMASCMQHLYMMPQARASILAADTEHAKHESTLRELQRMFAYLSESERKAYNPRSFCKVYTMDHQPLNTAEQKDMAEFFIDLVSKLEEMTPTLKNIIKELFCGVLTNNVVSLDCDHVSRTLEEFYTVRCQVADMRNLYESLDEVTVKDTLEGDNMYTCSQCGKKVRAEKRACFKKLPHILCFNTMRYTFNMLTMLKEKVNTHFSFPLRLNMSGYMEKQLMPQHYQEGQQIPTPLIIEGQYEYDLIGVTVHTGTADGGHYYSFIKDRTAGSRDKWFLFNDAEVKPFDPNQIAAECYGGEMTSKTYDSVTDKFMDFNFEKTNSAYMLFYERCSRSFDQQTQPTPDQQPLTSSPSTSNLNQPTITEQSSSTSSTSSGVSSCASSNLSDQVALQSDQQRLLTSPIQQQQVSPTLVNVAPSTSTSSSSSNVVVGSSSGVIVGQVELSSELEDWIWQDNMHFIQDKNIFEHTYFNFMWQICGYIPSTIMPLRPRITERATQLSTSFFIETFIHAKEKPTMVQWVELVTKQFNQCQEACIWFLEHMAADTWWPIQVLLKCPNQMVRQMFQRLCIHVIQRLRSSQSSLYLLIDEEIPDISPNDDENAINASRMGNASCVTKFVKTLLSLMAHGAKAQSKHLTEYFGFLYEFSRMGEDESKFLLNVGAIHIMVDFYLGYKINDFVDVSEGEEEEEVVTLPTDKHKPASLDKMVTLVASLVEKSRDPEQRLQLTVKDYSVVAGGKGFPFLYHQIKDNINLQQTKNLIHSLCRGNDRLATAIIGMLFQAISRNSEACQPFFKLLTLLTEGSSTSSTSIPATLLPTSPVQQQSIPSTSSTPTSVTPTTTILGGGLPGGLTCSFTQLVLQRVWEVAECCPYNAIEWLAVQVNRSRLVHQWVLSSLDTWLEHFLVGHGNQRVRNAAGNLLISLVPSTQFRQCFRGAHRQYRDPQLSPEAVVILHQVYAALLRLISSAKHYTDIQQHGTMKLTTFCGLLMFCCISRTEKLMFGQYFIPLWQLFHPKLAEPAIPAHHNKQAVLVFWNHVCTDCPENVQIMLQNAHVTKNIAFNYILADHEDQEIVIYNRAMLPAYYGLLRMMCQQSRIFTRQLAQHQNLQWAFKNITPHPSQYPNAVEELFKLMQLMVIKHPDTTELEEREICNFRRTTLTTYAQCLDGRCWTTLISAFRILVDSSDDRLFIAYNGGLQIVFESFQSLHMMLHEATACHVSLELIEVLSILIELMRSVRIFRNTKEARDILLQCKDWIEVIRKLASLLNTYNPPEMRLLCIDILKEFVNIMPNEVMQILVPLLSHCHGAFQDSQDAVPLGPYFPRRHLALPPSVAKGIRRPLRPMVQMTVPQNQLECAKGVDPAYDDALEKFYAPYHEFIDRLCRLAVSSGSMTDTMISLCSMIGFEAVPLHFTYFPKFWLDTMRSQNFDRKYLAMLTSCNYCVDYIESVLLDERIALTVEPIYEFLSIFFPKVSAQVLTDQTMNMIDSTIAALPEQVAVIDVRKFARRLAGDLRACLLAYRVVTLSKPPPQLAPSLQQLQLRVQKLIAELKVAADKPEPVIDEEKPSTSKCVDASDVELQVRSGDEVGDLVMLGDTIDQLLQVLSESDEDT